MQKLALSLLVIAASGAYVWQQSLSQPSDGLLDTTMLSGGRNGAAVDALLPPEGTKPGAPLAAVPPATNLTPATADTRDAETPAPPAVPVATTAAPAPTPAPVLPTPVVTTVPVLPPQPQARPTFRDVPVSVTNAAMTLAQSVAYADGTYTGPVTDAYYGPMQIQAIIQGGRLTEIKVLQWPNDRRTSIRINQQAIPWLRDEVIQAQSASVDIISGATLTSEAFIKSIGGALNQAAGH